MIIFEFKLGLTIDNNFLSPDSDDLKNSNLEKHENNISQLFKSIVQSNQQPSQNPFQKKEDFQLDKEKSNKDTNLQGDGFIKYDLKKSRFHFSPEKKNSVPDLDFDLKKIQESMIKRKSAIFYDPNADLSEKSPDLLSNLNNFTQTSKEKKPYFRSFDNKNIEKNEKESFSKNKVNQEDYNDMNTFNNENIPIPNGSKINSIASIPDENAKRVSLVKSFHELGFEEKIKTKPEEKELPPNKLLSPINIIPKKMDHKSFINLPNDPDRSVKDKKETRSFSFINEDNPAKSSCVWKEKFLQLRNDLESFSKKEEEFMKNLSSSPDQSSIEEQKSNFKENILKPEEKNVDLQLNKENSIRSFLNSEEIILNKSLKIDEKTMKSLNKEKEMSQAERKKEISPRILINNKIPISEKDIRSNVNAQSQEKKRAESFFNLTSEPFVSEIYRKTSISKDENFKIINSEQINSKIHSKKPSKANEELPISNLEKNKSDSFLISNNEQKSNFLKENSQKNNSNLENNNDLKNELLLKEKNQSKGSVSSLHYVENLISDPPTDRNQINSIINKKFILSQNAIENSFPKKEDDFKSVQNFNKKTYVLKNEGISLKINENKNLDTKNAFELNENEGNLRKRNIENKNMPCNSGLIDNNCVDSKNEIVNEFLNTANLQEVNYKEDLGLIEKGESRNYYLKKNRDIKSEIFQSSNDNELISYFSIQPMTQKNQAQKNKTLFEDLYTPNSNKSEKYQQMNPTNNNLETSKNQAIPLKKSERLENINSFNNNSENKSEKQKDDEKNNKELKEGKSSININASNPSKLNNSPFQDLNLKPDISNNFERIKSNKLNALPLSAKDYSCPKTNEIIPLRSTKEIKGSIEEENLSMEFLKKRWNEFLEKTEKKASPDKLKNKKIDDPTNFLTENLENKKNENPTSIKSFKSIGKNNEAEENLKNLKILEIERAQENDRIQIRSLSNFAREKDANFSESTPFKIQTENLDIRSNENKDIFNEESIRSEKTSTKSIFENKKSSSFFDN